MVVGDVNPLERRHMALSSRFKAAWACHQLLTGMERISSSGPSESKSDTFQSLFGRIRSLSDQLQGPTIGQETLTPEMTLLEREVDDLYAYLLEREATISPSKLRRFLTQVRSLDDRILIEVIRFYLEVQSGKEWELERFDKVDFLLSRLAERVAGPQLQTDDPRLAKVLQAIVSSADRVEMDEVEIAGLISTLQDMRSEIRWVKTLEDLNESGLVQLYRALKHDLKGRMFHIRLLPLVVEVNHAFRARISELRSREEARLLEEYRKLGELQSTSTSDLGDLSSDLNDLEKQVERFRQRAKTDDIRLADLAKLGDTLRELSERLQHKVATERPPTPTVEHANVSSPAIDGSQGGVVDRRPALVLDIEALQPEWSELLQALSAAGDGIGTEEADVDSRLTRFALEGRELLAYRRTTGADPADIALEEFILAGAALRSRIRDRTAALRAHPVSADEAAPRVGAAEARQAASVADAFVHHFRHWLEQSVLAGDVDEARHLRLLRAKLERELAELELEVATRAAEPPL